MAFGTGSHFRYIPVHELTASLDSRMCSTLHVFHAFTGCNIVSSFLAWRGKKTAWFTWQSYPEATGAFEDLLIGDHTMSTLERLVVLLYDRTSDITMVNDCRKQLFTRKYRILKYRKYRIYHLRRQNFSNMSNGPLIRPSAGPRL